MSALPTLLPFMGLLFILPFRGTVAFRMVCLGSAILVVIYFWRALAPPRIPCKLAIGLWALIAAVSLIGAVDPAYSLGEIKNEIVYTTIAFVAFFAVTRQEADLKWLLLALFSGAVILCAGAIESRWQLGAWQERRTFYGGSGAFAGYAAAVLPMLFLYAACTPERRRRAVIVALFALLAVTTFLSLQRIVWAAFALQGLIAVALLVRGGLLRLSWMRLIGAGCIIIALTIGIFLAVQAERFKGDEVGEVTRDTRLKYWPSVVQKIAEHPFVGAGFGRGIMNKADRDLTPANNPMLWHAHNVFLNYGYQMGVPGMLVFAWLVFCLLREYWRLSQAPDDKLKLLGMAGIMLIAGVMLRNQASDEFLRDASILFWALNGALLGFGHRRMAQLGLLDAVRPREKN
ncbi:MAG: O-antigen ligase family protein [Burkholderiales bacterium]